MRNREKDEEPKFAPLAEPNPTPSQRATLPYFLVALVLFLLQAVLGSVTGHYAVEGNKIFGLDLTHLIPYAATRTWHLQLAVFWIATCWLATGLVIGPVIGGKEPKGQKALVVTLLAALPSIYRLGGPSLASRASAGVASLARQPSGANDAACLGRSSPTEKRSLPLGKRAGGWPGFHTSSPTARMRARAFECVTTPGRSR